MASAFDLVISTAMEVKDQLTGKWLRANNAEHEVQQAPAAVRVVGWVLVLVKNVLLLSCLHGVAFFFLFGLFATVSISIGGLMDRHHYGDADEGKINMDPAHNILYVVCLAEIALSLYRFILRMQTLTMVKEVSQAYGFQDGGIAVAGYISEITQGCFAKPSTARERNLITYAVELMESKSPLGDSFLSGTLILDRLLTRQQQQQHQLTEQEIIRQQRKVIKQLIGSESSTQILQQLLETLYSRHSYGRKMREAAARIVEHVSGGIRLEQFPRGIQCISSLINTFEATTTTRLPSESDSANSESESELDSDEVPRAYKNERLIVLDKFWRLPTRMDNYNVTTTSSKTESENGMDQPSSSSEDNSSKTNPFRGYKELVVTGFRILWRLASNEDNCTIISNTENLVSKIMAPVSCDLLHRAGHSEWSTKVSERSLGVMLRLIVTAKGDTRVELRHQISSDKGAITTMERIASCEECKGGELQMKAMQILTQLCMDKTENRGKLTKMLISIFVNGDDIDGSIRKTAGKTLAVLFLSTKSVASLLSKEENDKFLGDLKKMILKVGEDDTCRRCAAEILENLCINYIENEQYLSTLKRTMTCLMPKVLREILCGLTGEEGPGYARSGTDVESQVTTSNDKNNNNRTSSSPGQNKHQKLHVALLSLCVTACAKLHLDIDTISLREGDQARDQGECVVFSLAMKMVQVNRDLITADNLKAMKLITRMVIAAMKKLRDQNTIVQLADLQSLIDSLSSISDTMLDLEGSMVFAAGTTTAVPDTADTLDSLVKQARQLHSEI